MKDKLKKLIKKVKPYTEWMNADNIWFYLLICVAMVTIIVVPIIHFDNIDKKNKIYINIVNELTCENQQYIFKDGEIYLKRLNCNAETLTGDIPDIIEIIGKDVIIKK